MQPQRRGPRLAQLALFEGTHLPRSAAREALARADLDGARAELARAAGAPEESADAARLARIGTALAGAGADAVAASHEAFRAAFTATSARGFLAEAEWFHVYARCVSRALEAEPGRRFRGWLGAHYAFAAGDSDAARRASARIAASASPGAAWLEAARLAFALGDAAEARTWLHAACLESGTEIAPAAPALEPCGVPALDAPPPLPALPAPVEDAFDAARALEDLPGPWTRWAAVVGEIDRVLGPASAREGETQAVDASSEADTADDPPRAFLAALRAARRSRERDHTRGAEHCSDRELRARRRMQRVSPALLARYVHRLDGELL